MEQLNTNISGGKGGLKNLGTALMLTCLLLTQYPQTIQAQNTKNNKPTTEEVVNDSTIQGEFTPELIASIGEWVNNRFEIKKEYLRKDTEGKEFVTINGNDYYNIYNLFLEEPTGLGFLWLAHYSHTPDGFYIGAIKKGQIGGNGILIQQNGNHYKGSFEEGLFEGYGVQDFGDGRHYEGEFHEGEFHGNGTMTWKNGDYYEGNFIEGKRSGEGKMIGKYGEIYEGTWKDDNPIKDPRYKKNPLIFGKGTYSYPNNDQIIYEITNSNRPNFISVEDKKEEENWDKKRGNIIYITKIQEGKASYELHSWDRDINYILDETHFVFSAKDGADLKFPKEIGEKKAKAIANLINSIMNMVKNNEEGYRLYAFDYQGNTLQAQYRGKFFDVDLVKDIPGKIGISAKEFSNWLNHYRKNKPDREY